MPDSVELDVQRCLRGSSDLTDDGRVEAIMGLSLRPTHHRIKIGDTQLYTWCALDLLFIPPSLGVTAAIESSSPASGEVVRAVVTPHGIHDIQPEGAVVSVVPIVPEEDEIRGAFCNFVHFFASDADALSWQTSHPEGWVLAADKAFELGMRVVDRLGGDSCS